MGRLMQVNVAVCKGQFRQSATFFDSEFAVVFRGGVGLRCPCLSLQASIIDHDG